MASPKPAPAYSEADLCAAFLADVAKVGGWTAYPEIGPDIVLVRDADGLQIGIEAKLQLGPQVVCQILPDRRGWIDSETGPNHRAVLVPWSKCGVYLPDICAALGITVIRMEMTRELDPWRGTNAVRFSPSLPQIGYPEREWTEWGPVRRIKLPDYVPDVEAGHPSPAPLTSWKIKAIKLAILLETRAVTRADMKHLELDPKLWCDPQRGWLTLTPHGYVWPEGRKRDFEREHPRNYAEIKADRVKWEPPSLAGGGVLYPHLTQGTLI